MGWSLVETSVEREFDTFWLAQGRSKTAIREMDWTASQQIDLLIAVGKLHPTLGETIHRLRKRRNAVVHDLADATQEEVERCLGVALGMTGLPQLAETLKPKTVFL